MSTIGKRIGISYLLMAVLLAVIGGAGLFAADRISQALDRITGPIRTTTHAVDSGIRGVLQQMIGVDRALDGHDEEGRRLIAAGDALSAASFSEIAQAGLVNEGARIVLEKPVGRDFDSARRINDEVGEVFEESNIYRIDHYLGKETVQNLLAMRFANSLFEPLWNRGTIDHVQITVAEDLGVGNRVEFYDKIGALRDMVQNHIMQLLCLIAMEPPSSLHHDSVRDEKIKVLKALRPIGIEDVGDHTVRGQYTSGAIDGKVVPGYREELGEERDSETETFVAIKAEVDNWRWAGVPFYIRTGKRMPKRVSEIAVQFKSIPPILFNADADHPLPPGTSGDHNRRVSQ